MIIIQEHLEVYGNITNEPNDNLADSELFKSKVKITGNTPNDGNRKDFEVIVPLKVFKQFLEKSWNAIN